MAQRMTQKMTTARKKERRKKKKIARKRSKNRRRQERVKGQIACGRGQAREIGQDRAEGEKKKFAQKRKSRR